MIRIRIPAGEFFDEDTNKFITIKETTLEFEHSLISLSKWESKWKKPFLGKAQRTDAETLDYIRAMCLNRDPDPNAFLAMTPAQISELGDYIADTMTATTIRETGSRGGREIITAEIIYFWMVTLQIPFECQKWHLNRLITLVRVINEKNKPAKKIPRSEMINRNRSLNAQRRQRHNSKG